jgi:catalase (peroxidase I)
MKRSNNQTIQTKEYIICINDETEINQIREESENPSLQTKISRVTRKFDEKKIKQNLQQLQTQRKKWHLDIEMHFVGLFIVLMITQK